MQSQPKESGEDEKSKEKEIEKNENLENSLIQSSTSNSDVIEQNKKFIDNYFEKLSKKSGYSVTMGIFICLKNNNYIPLTKEEIFEQLKLEFRKNPHKFIKYGKNNGYFENEIHLKQACFLSVMENQAFNKKKENDILYISVNYMEAIEYLKSLKKHKVNVPMDDEDLDYLFTKFRRKRKPSNSVNNNSSRNENINQESIAKKVHRRRGNVEMPNFDLSSNRRNLNKIEQIELSDDTGDEGGVYNINNSTSSIIDEIVSRKKKPKINENGIIPPPQSPIFRNNEEEKNEEKKNNENTNNNSSYNDNDNENNFSTEFQNDIRIFKSKIKEIKNFLLKENPKLDEMIENIHASKDKFLEDLESNDLEDSENKYFNIKNEVIKNKEFLQIIYLSLKDEIKCLKNIIDIENIFSKEIIEEHSNNIKLLENNYISTLDKLCEGIEYLCKKSNYNNKQKLLKELMNTSNILKENGINMEELSECSNNLKKINFQNEQIFSIEEIKEYYESIKNKLINKIEKENVQS